MTSKIDVKIKWKLNWNLLEIISTSPIAHEPVLEQAEATQ